MANAVLIEDTKGELVDAIYYCSDLCAKSDSAYAGWYGCVELDFGQTCSAEGCSEQIHGLESCSCGEAFCRGYLRDPR